MQTVLTSEFKRGMVLLLDGAPQLLEEFHVSGTAQTRHKLHARLRHLKTGRLTDHTFSEGERVPVADVQHRRVQFSYHDGKDFVFSDVESFDELTLNAEQIDERRWFIKENLNTARCCSTGGWWTSSCHPRDPGSDGTDPPIRGGSDTTWKPAKLDTGLEIMVPLFIAPGEKIHVDTTNRKYAGRENEGKK